MESAELEGTTGTAACGQDKSQGPEGALKASCLAGSCSEGHPGNQESESPAVELHRLVAWNFSGRWLCSAGLPIFPEFCTGFLSSHNLLNPPVPAGRCFLVTADS